jgi:hypothetical protein
MSSGKLPDITKANIKKAADSITANNSSFHTQLIALLKFAKTVWPQQHIASYANYLQLKEQIIALLDTAKDNAKNITESLDDDPNARDMETTFQKLTENINTIHTFLDHAEGKYKHLITTVITEIDNTLQDSESALGDQEYTQKMTNKREKLRKDQVMFTVQKLVEQEIITIDHTTKTITLHENYTQNDLATLKTQIAQVIKLKNDSTEPSAWLTQVAAKVGYTYQKGVETVRSRAVVEPTDNNAEVVGYSPEALALACLTQLANIDWAKYGLQEKPLFTFNQNNTFIAHKYGDKQWWWVDFHNKGFWNALKNIINTTFKNENTSDNITTDNRRWMNNQLLENIILFLCTQAKVHVKFIDHARNKEIQENEEKEKAGEQKEGSLDIVSFLDTLASMNFSNDETSAFHPFITIDHEKHEVRLHPLDLSSLSLWIKQATWYKKWDDTTATKLWPSTLKTLIKHIFTQGTHKFNKKLFQAIFTKTTYLIFPTSSMSWVEFVERLKILCKYIWYTISSNDKEGAGVGTEGGAGVGTEGAAATIERKGEWAAKVTIKEEEANTKPSYEAWSPELQKLGTKIYDFMTKIVVTLPDGKIAKLCHKTQQGKYVFALITQDNEFVDKPWNLQKMTIAHIDGIVDRNVLVAYQVQKLDTNIEDLVWVDLRSFLYHIINDFFKQETTPAKNRFAWIQQLIGTRPSDITFRKLKSLFTGIEQNGNNNQWKQPGWVSLFELAAMEWKAERITDKERAQELWLLQNTPTTETNRHIDVNISPQQAHACLVALSKVNWNAFDVRPLFIFKNNVFEINKTNSWQWWVHFQYTRLWIELRNEVIMAFNNKAEKKNQATYRNSYRWTYRHMVQESIQNTGWYSVSQ